MNEERLDRIDSYVLHKMDDAEVVAFEEEMEADESLANEVRDTEMIVDALAERERKRKSLEQFKNSYPLYREKVEQLEAERNAAAYRVACEAAMPEQEVAYLREYQKSSVASKNKEQGWKWLSAIVGIAACVAAVFFLTLPSAERNTPMKSAPETPTPTIQEGEPYNPSFKGKPKPQSANEDPKDSLKNNIIKKEVRGTTK